MSEALTLNPSRALNGYPKLSAKSLKVTCVVDPAQLVGMQVPPGKRFTMILLVNDRRYRVDFNAKSLRKAVTTVTEQGADTVVVVVQGKLVGEAIEEAGITVAPKVPKSEPVDPDKQI